MQYFGGKQRIAAGVSAYLNSLHPERYLEPFIGGLNILPRIDAPRRVGSDLCAPLITLYRALQTGWTPPEVLTEEEYLRLKETRDPADPLTAFAAFGCSFAAKWFGGYARRKGGTNFAAIAARSLAKKFALVRPSDIFMVSDFLWWGPLTQGWVIYCDPPYRGATSYGAVPKFDSDAFWGWVRARSKDNTVVVSEYSAPEDFRVVAEFPTRTSIRDAGGQTIARVERLFQYSLT